MYRSLIVNTVISAAAYFAISVVGIVVVGWLVAGYGLAAYGVITLARLFLPSGLAGVIDLGAPENASHAIATARATQDWHLAGAIVGALACMVAAVSLVPAALLAGMAPVITGWFDLPGSDAPVFTHALEMAALCLPFLMLGSVAEGVIRGFERYGMARGIEVSMSLAYGIGCYFFIGNGWSHVSVIYLGIALAFLRAILAMLLCILCLRGTAIRFTQWRTVGLSRAWERTRVTAPIKILSSLQTQTQPLIIGIFLGPASAAIYDVLTRLPRFAKSILGLLNSAVMPFTSRLEAAEENVTRVAENGMVWVAILSAPPIFAAASFSQPLLHLWIGKELTGYWFWQSLGFLVPLVTVLLGFGFSSLFSRIHINRIANIYVIVRMVLQYAIAFALMQLLAERAFILGSALAVAATAFWEFRIIFREHRISRAVIHQLLKLGAVGAMLTCITLVFASAVSSIPVLLVSMGLYVLLFWALLWVWAIPTHTKKALIKLCR